jgi:hypothetical protein
MINVLFLLIQVLGPTPVVGLGGTNAAFLRNGGVAVQHAAVAAAHQR